MVHFCFPQFDLLFADISSVFLCGGHPFGDCDALEFRSLEDIKRDLIRQIRQLSRKIKFVSIIYHKCSSSKYQRNICKYLRSIWMHSSKRPRLISSTFSSSLLNYVQYIFTLSYTKLKIIVSSSFVLVKAFFSVV